MLHGRKDRTHNYADVSLTHSENWTQTMLSLYLFQALTGPVTLALFICGKHCNCLVFPIKKKFKKIDGVNVSAHHACSTNKPYNIIKALYSMFELFSP